MSLEGSRADGYSAGNGFSKVADLGRKLIGIVIGDSVSLHVVIFAICQM